MLAECYENIYQKMGRLSSLTGRCHVAKLECLSPRMIIAQKLLPLSFEFKARPNLMCGFIQILRVER